MAKKPAKAPPAVKQVVYFRDESPVAQRQPKTDRLILAKKLDEASKDLRLDDDEVAAAHQVIVRWADMETSGQLAKFTETQLQGMLLDQVFGDALGYAQPTDDPKVWHQEQHRSIGPGQVPDAALGRFTPDEASVLAVVELKGPAVHLDRDRSNGRTAVDQCWDYLVNMPAACRWGVVSNIVSFRLYERDSTKRTYEHFTLQGMRDAAEFRRFYVLLGRQGLVEGIAREAPRAIRLLRETNNRQREVSDELYKNYSHHRFTLIEHLLAAGHPPDDAVEMAQRLFDRVIFIAFCEDRDLLPERTLAKAAKVEGFHDVTNPRWRQFKNLFKFVDGGNERYSIPKYNGGLFAKHAVDDLDLPDEPWTKFFESLSGYDFRDEVNLDVLGRLFERSITELEKIKQGGLFEAGAERRREYASMPQSAKRKQLGIYYTPAELTSRIVQYTVEELIRERFAAAAVEFGVSREDAARGFAPDEEKFWRRCLDILCDLKIVDPACGSGAFLFQAYNTLEQRYHEVVDHLAKFGAGDAEELAERIPHLILGNNLYGVDLSPEAVEITQLALWIRSATPGQTLAVLSSNIVHGNSLVHDASVHPDGFDWRERFPEVFYREGAQNPPPSKGGARGRIPARASTSKSDGATSSPSLPRPLPSREGGFDCVIGNPPWERIKLQEREFFSLPAPEIATATNAAKRRQLVAKLESDDPALYERYQQAQVSAEALLTYCRKSKEYPLTGRGDINLYAVFAELAFQIVAPTGRVGLLTPSGIASDKTTMDFFAAIAESNRLIRLYDFENRTKRMFPEVDNRFKFCIFNFGGEKLTRKAADFVFFAHHVDELEDPKRHVSLSGDDIRLLNPNTRTCPIFRTKRDAEITKAIYRRVPVLIDHRREGPTANPWNVEPKRKFDQDSKAEWFREAGSLQKEGFKLRGNQWVKGKLVYVPLYEAKMVQVYDHRAANAVIDEANWVRQGQKIETSLVEHQNPEHRGQSRYWIHYDNVASEMGPMQQSYYVAFKKITSSTNTRTMIAACIPDSAPVDSLPFMFFQSAIHARLQLCLLANLNTISYDFVARQKVQGNHLQHYHIAQIPTLTPDAYAKPCPWDRKTTLEAWISERVLKLTCTAEDMRSLAEACDFRSGSFQTEYDGRLNKWDEAERAQLMAELDAAYFHLYGVDREDAAYILSTFKGIHADNPLLEDRRSTAEHILRVYDELAPS